MTTLKDALRKIPDPRHRRGVRYPSLELLLLLLTIVCAVVSGAKTLTMVTEWARAQKRNGLHLHRGRAPSLATIHRATARIDPVVLNAVINEWVRQQTRQRTPDRSQTVIAIDGKEVRGAKNGGGKRVFLFAALDHATGAVIEQESIGEKTNEIPHFQPLLDQIRDRGC